MKERRHPDVSLSVSMGAYQEILGFTVFILTQRKKCIDTIFGGKK